jgi:uncharacterized protein YbjQ (UPF0145 family)
MNKINIISSHIIDGYRITSYLGVIHAGPFVGSNGFANLQNDVVNQANNLGADWVVGFTMQIPPTDSSVNQQFSGFGTAVKAEQTS